MHTVKSESMIMKPLSYLRCLLSDSSEATQSNPGLANLPIINKHGLLRDGIGNKQHWRKPGPKGLYVISPGPAGKAASAPPPPPQKKKKYYDNVCPL